MFGSVLLSLCLMVQLDQAVEADVVLRGAMLHDGSGQPGVVGDLAIKGDRIVGLGKLALQGSPRIIDAQGLIVAPGFIDLHTHSDEEIQQPATRSNLNYLTQGVTTIVANPDGGGPVDLAAQRAALEKGGLGPNVALLIGHTAVRRAVRWAIGNIDDRR